MNIEKFSDRLIMVLALVSIFLIVDAIFINGCVLSIDSLTVGQVCPDKPKDCFIYDSLVSMSPSQSFVCTPGEPVIPINSSAYRTFCYGYILGDQKTVDILNQLGICTGILTLSANVLWVFCWMTSRWWGLLIYAILGIGGVVAIIVIQFARVPYQILILVLIFLCIILPMLAVYIVLRN